VEPLTLMDRRILAAQLGRSPRGASSVETRCAYGYPQVVSVYPVIEGEPFPTLYWLSCPVLVRQIDRLEAAGWVKRLEARLSSDAQLAARFSSAHRAYIAERLALLGAADRAALEAAGRLSSLTERGIGGTADRSRVKCLHLHAAHELARDNPVGKIVLSLLPRRSCAGEDVLCASL